MMINNIILALYLVIVVMYILITLFIAYHFYKYSFNPENRLGFTALFLGVSLALLISNMLVFFSINWGNLISNIIN